MAGFSSFVAQNLLLTTLMNGSMPNLTGLKIALFGSDPAGDLNNELPADGNPWYTRQACSSWTAPYHPVGDPLAWECANVTQVTFTVTGGTSVTHWGVTADNNQGTLLYSGEITDGSPKQILDAETLYFAPGSLKVRIKV